MKFTQKVYYFVAQIPRGQVATYGQIAILCGNPNASRAVGYALHNNKDNCKVPCHRVVNKFGDLATGFVFGGQSVQKELLQNEGVLFCDDKVNLQKCLWQPRLTT